MNGKSPVKIDVHMHLAGSGCCNSGCWVSPTFKTRHTFRLLRMIHRISARQMHSSIDADWATKVALVIKNSAIDYGVVLGFDGVYDTSHGAFDQAKSQMVIPPEWVFKVCRDHPGLLPGPSVNPYRKDALSRLEYCINEGAVLIKWLPAAQGIDPGDRKLDSFYRMAARARLPLLIHMGGERTFHSVAPEFNNVNLLRQPLDAGVPVICAHSATRLLGTNEVDQTPELKRLLAEYPHLWVDNSGLCTPVRFSHVPRLAQDPEISARTLYGSDFPVPSNAFYYTKALGLRQMVQLERMKNVVDRDIAIKRHFGYEDATLTRANAVLANLAKWVR